MSSSHSRSGFGAARLPRRSVLGLGAAAMVGLAAGCRTAVSGQGVSGAASASASPRPGGTLSIVQPNVATGLTPLGAATFAFTYRRAVFDTLLDVDPVAKTTVPVLATSWQLSPDNKTVTLKLRSGVTWHSGRPFTAQDVVFAIQKSIQDKPVSPFAWMFSDMQGLDAVDAQTVKIDFATPKPTITDALSVMIMFDQDSYADFRAGKANIGTGPFVWDSYQPNVSIGLKKNPHYWQPGHPYLDGINVRFLTAETALAAAVQTKQADMGFNLLNVDLQRLKASGGFDITNFVTFGNSFYIGANVNVKPLDNPTVRQAINYGIDRARISNDVYGGTAKHSAAPWSPVSPAYDPSYDTRYVRDVDKAKQMLASAGAAGAPIVLELAQSAAQLADIVSFNLTEIGLKPTTSVVSAAVGQDEFTNRSFKGLYVAAHGYTTLAPADLIYGSVPFNPSPDANLFNVNDSKYQQLAAAMLTAQGDAAQAAWKDVTEEILELAFCCDIVQTTVDVVTHGLTGWKYNTWDELLLADAYL